jgi:hypothetical protein
VTTDGWKLRCNKCKEPISQTKKRERKNASFPVPIEKRRTYRSSTRYGCPFQVSFCRIKSEDNNYRSVKITNSSNYKHGNGYLEWTATASGRPVCPSLLYWNWKTSIFPLSFLRLGNGLFTKSLGLLKVASATRTRLVTSEPAWLTKVSVATG